MTKKMALRALFMLSLPLALFLASGLEARAQGMMTNPHGFLGGTVESITASSITVGGFSASLASDSVLVGMDRGGNLLTLNWSDFQPGVVAAVFLERENGAMVARALYRGHLFMAQGVVTALQADGQGRPRMLTLDSGLSVNVSQAVFDGMSPGDMQGGMGGDMNGGMMGGGMMGGGMGTGMMGNGDSTLVQVGSTVALGGIADEGVFGAVFAHVMASGMMENGSIQSVTHDMMGNVTGFAMTGGARTTQVALDASTQITRKGQPMAANSLQSGMHVRVDGLSRQDGSVLARSVAVKGGMGGMH